MSAAKKTEEVGGNKAAETTSTTTAEDLLPASVTASPAVPKGTACSSNDTTE